MGIFHCVTRLIGIRIPLRILAVSSVLKNVFTFRETEGFIILIFSKLVVFIVRYFVK